MPINYLKKIRLNQFDANNYRIEPPATLAAVIEGFYVFTRNIADQTQLIFNDGLPSIVFLQNETHAVNMVSATGSLEIKGAWLNTGQIRNVYVNYHTSTDQVFIVRFHPAACYQLFKLNPSHFTVSTVTAFTSIAQQCGFDLSIFFNCNTIEEKVLFFESYVNLAFSGNKIPAALDHTLNHIHQQKGKGSVKIIAGDVGLHYKWLERSFAQHIGLLPKVYLQLQRFIHAYLELVESKEVNLMQISLSNGYYDYNHFLKDFKTYTGQTPLTYLNSFHASKRKHNRADRQG